MKHAAWFIPSFIGGSGGYRTIFQHINYMSSEYQCDVYVYDSGDYRSEEEIKAREEKLYGKCRCRFILGHKIPSGKSYDVLVATSWLTADIVHHYPGGGKKLYFVQDYEPLFYPAGDTYLRAAGTYELGFSHITIGRWLTHRLKENHGADAAYFDFGADKAIYCYDERIRRENAVCFIYQPDKPRRGAGLGLDALALVKKMRPEVKIYLYGSFHKKYPVFEYTDLGLLSPAQCAKLYNKCQVGLCISASNPSRIPFEMMACGLSVVDIHAENNLYDYPNNVIVLAKCRAEALAQAVVDLLDDASRRNQIRDNALRFMEDRDICREALRFTELVNLLVSGEKICQKIPQKLYSDKPVLAEQKLEKTWEILMAEKKTDIWKRLGHNYFIRKVPGIRSLGRLLRNGYYRREN